MPLPSGESKHLTIGSPEPQLDASTLTVYSMRFCPYSRRVLLVLHKKKIPHKIVNINLKAKPEWYLEHVNPLGRVPTLYAPGRNDPLFESLIGAEYLDGQYPGDGALLPRDAYEAAQQRILIEVITQKVINHLNVLGVTGDTSRMGELSSGLSDVEKLLTSDYFAGSRLGFVDLMIWPFFERLPFISDMRQAGVNLEKDHPKLFAWTQRMLSDVTIQEASFPPDIMTRFTKSAYIDQKPDYDIGLQ
ncbi:glutathione S-transferase omega-1-like [Paramacrobiotus metropolitanus]|uniref:glutathione S-transferase omega-1-like n=1 Tax=Paramacrobiotus metropolitanus TaxID=2943436 RepID=UPI002445BD02|nr:glutathione S-transferase omega-1-like [Paramacrobiotus metropolitanus]